MNKKKVAQFLLLAPAFNSRNMTSILLVLLFFGVYVASGGKVTSVPKIQSGANFGVPDEVGVVGKKSSAVAPSEQGTSTGRKKWKGLIAETNARVASERAGRKASSDTTTGSGVSASGTEDPASANSSADQKLKELQERLNRVGSRARGGQ